MGKMIGVTLFAWSVSTYRLEHDELARAWNRRGRADQKAVACYDEESVAMAEAAEIDCLR